MKRVITLAFKNPLIFGSTVIFFGSMAANILNYIFNVGTARLLTRSDYGTLISLISLFNIFAVFSTTISIIFTKFSAVFIGQKKENLIGYLFMSGSLWIGTVSFLVSGLIIIFSHQISNFLNIDSQILIIIISISLFFSYVSYVGIGILQGLLRFGYYSFINITSSLLKLFLGISFILFGFKVFGAMIAFFLSIVASYILVLPPLYKYIKKNNHNGFSIPQLRKQLSKYGLPVFLSNIGMTAFITIDIILVKHFFNPDIAGQYAAISIMGRSIFFAISPITLVLFPLVAQKKERKESLSNIVILSIFLIAIPSIALSMIYFVFPEIIRIVFFPTYEAKLLNPYLGPFSIFILFYAFSYLLNTFYLAIGKIGVCLFTILGATLEIILIWFFHKDIDQIINMLIISSFLLLLSLLLYYPRATKP